MMIHTVIFDVGQTLIDAPPILQRLSQLFPQLGDSDGLNMITATFNHYYHGAAYEQKEFLYIVDMIRNTLSEVSAKLGCEDKGPLAGEIQWDNFVNNSKLCSDTLETLTRLKNNGIKIIIASDADAPLLYEQFRMYDLSRFFDYSVISGEVKAYKPSDGFVNALRPHLNGNLNGVLFVGDSVPDILTGKKLSVRTVLKGEAKTEGILPDFRIGSLADIFKLESFL